MRRTPSCVSPTTTARAKTARATRCAVPPTPIAPAVRVNAVAPGFITTRWLKEGLGQQVYDGAKKRTEESVILRRVCDPEDVAAAILNIITGPDLMTGNVIPLEGGQLVSNFHLI